MPQQRPSPVVTVVVLYGFDVAFLAFLQVLTSMYPPSPTEPIPPRKLRSYDVKSGSDQASIAGTPYKLVVALRSRSVQALPLSLVRGRDGRTVAAVHEL